MLRPIGTEFTVEYPPNKISTNPCGARHTFKVVAHKEVFVDNPDYYSDTSNCPKRMAEEIKIIAIEEIPLNEYDLVILDGIFHYVKKDEIIHRIHINIGGKP